MFCMFVPLLTVQLPLFASVRHQCRPSAYTRSQPVRREAVHLQEHIVLSDGWVCQADIWQEDYFKRFFIKMIVLRGYYKDDAAL